MIRYRAVTKRRTPKDRQLVKDNEYRALSQFRHHIDHYLEFSDIAAKAAGIEPRQYQLMLSIKGLPINAAPTVGTLAERLNIRHHSTVELVNRAENNGFVCRERAANGSHVYVRLTPKGLQILERAVAERLKELQSAGPVLVDTLRRLLRSADKPKRGRKQSKPEG